MLTAEIKINGALIGTVCALNKGCVSVEEDIYRYTVTCHRIDSDTVYQFEMHHKGSDGAEELVRASLEELVKNQLPKKNKSRKG